MARRMSRFIHFGMASAREAVDASGLDFSDWSPEQRDRSGVVINTGGGGMEQVIDGTETLEKKGAGQVSPFAIPALSGSMAGSTGVVHDLKRQRRAPARSSHSRTRYASSARETAMW